MTRRHFAGLIILLLIKHCQMSPLLPNKDGDQIKDGDQTAAEESASAPKMTLLSERMASADQASAASDHGHVARVQMKVYRGPDDPHHHRAPYGYWVKQPADDAIHHH